MSARRAPERGAALLEILLALAITALLASGAVGVVRFGLTAIERAEAAAARSGQAAATRRRLTEILSRIDAGPDAATGNETAFAWRGAVPTATGWDFGRWRLEGAAAALLRCEDAGETCVRYETIGDAPLRFRYADDEGAWAEAWPRGAAPALVAVAPADGTDDGTPEIVAAPRVRGLGR